MTKSNVEEKSKIWKIERVVWSTSESGNESASDGKGKRKPKSRLTTKINLPDQGINKNKEQDRSCYRIKQVGRW